MNINLNIHDEKGPRKVPFPFFQGHLLGIELMTSRGIITVQTPTEEPDEITITSREGLIIIKPQAANSVTVRVIPDFHKEKP